MSVIDLSATSGPGTADADDPVSGIPGGGRVGRVALTLPELRYAADLCRIRLPFTVPDRTTTRLDDRLGGLTGTRSDIDEAFAAFPDPAVSLRERGLLSPSVTVTGREEDGPDGEDVAPLVVEVLRLVAGPEVAVDLDIALDSRRGPARMRCWHHAGGELVATLSSANGAVFEAGLMPLASWPLELARVATPPAAVGATTGAGETGVVLPDGVELPLDLLNAGCDALRARRDEVARRILARHSGETTLSSGAVVSDALVAQYLRRLARSLGRLRALVTRPGPHPSANVGVLSWVLLEDGWRHLQPVGGAGDPRVRLTRVTPSKLSVSLSPLLAEVIG